MELEGGLVPDHEAGGLRAGSRRRADEGADRRLPDVERRHGVAGLRRARQAREQVTGRRIEQHPVAHPSDAVEQLGRVVLVLAQQEDANALLEDRHPQRQRERGPREPHAPGLEDDREIRAHERLDRLALERPEDETKRAAPGVLYLDVAL
jgi:hypothetical protein